MEKTYYLIYMYFGDNLQNRYKVFEYQKSRRFTAGQAWKHIRLGNHPSRYDGCLKPSATIEDYWNIVNELHLDSKMCDRYVTFGFIH